jgi:hypothetical protein
MLAGGGVEEGGEAMMSPRERYANDPVFHKLVDTMIGAIMQCQYTPSEMRDAALFASIRYEETHVRPRIYPKEITDWLDGKELTAQKEGKV